MGFIGNLFGGGDSGMNYQAQGPNRFQTSDTWANSQAALQQQQAFLQAAYNSGGLQNQANVFGQQQGLANQLQDASMGGGPNPAQAQFQQNSQQAAAQAAGLIGSQKGMSPALQARLVAQQGAQAGQNAAGQAAQLQAQQQIAARQQLQAQQGQMAGLSSQQVAQQQGALNAYQQGALGQQGNILGLQGSANSANSNVQNGVAKQQGGLFGGVLGGVGSVLGLAHGGAVPAAPGGGPMSKCAQHFASGGMAKGGAIQGEKYAHKMKPVPGKAKVKGDSGKNDTVAAKLSPGEIILPRSVSEHPNAPEMAARFVAAVKAKQGRGIG